MSLKLHQSFRFVFLAEQDRLRAIHAKWKFSMRSDAILRCEKITGLINRGNESLDAASVSCLLAIYKEMRGINEPTYDRSKVIKSKQSETKA